MRPDFARFLFAAVTSVVPAVALGQEQGTPIYQGTPIGAAESSTESTSTAPSSTEPEPLRKGCVPECRSGYSCVDAVCVSSCNPACAVGEQCTATGECVRSTDPGDTRGSGDPGWAVGAGVLGVIGGAATLGLAAASAATVDQREVALPTGITATVLFGGVVPIVAVGGASARTHPEVRGALGLRITSWIAYGGALVNAAVLIGMGIEEVRPHEGIIVAVGALGAASAVFMAADAFTSAGQARRLGAAGSALEDADRSTFRLVPVFAALPNRHAGVDGYLGLAGTF